MAWSQSKKNNNVCVILFTSNQITSEIRYQVINPSHEYLVQAIAPVSNWPVDIILFLHFSTHILLFIGQSDKVTLCYLHSFCSRWPIAKKKLNEYQKKKCSRSTKRTGHCWIRIFCVIQYSMYWEIGPMNKYG